MKQLRLRLNYDLCITLVYETEAELDKFLQSWTLHGVAEKVKCPYLLVGGEDDQLSPVEYGLQLMDLISAPKQMLMYEGALHSVSGSRRHNERAEHWHIHSGMVQGPL